QAEDGIRDLIVTGVQTCALPISGLEVEPRGEPQVLVSRPGIAIDASVLTATIRVDRGLEAHVRAVVAGDHRTRGVAQQLGADPRSEERRVGKECRCRWVTSYEKE